MLLRRGGEKLHFSRAGSAEGLDVPQATAKNRGNWGGERVKLPKIQNTRDLLGEQLSELGLHSL